MPSPGARNSPAVAVLTGLAVAGACAALALAARRANKKDLGPDERQIELLPMEQKLYQTGEPPINTITWFRGNYVDALKILEPRLKEIVDKNPWLGGRVVVVDGKATLRYSTKPPSYNDFLKLASSESSPIARTTDLAMLATKTIKFALKNGLHERLFQVSILPCKENPTTHFALLFSVSHFIVDGHTFYQLQSMLCSKADPIIGLIVERIQSTTQQQQDLLGFAECSILTSTSPAMILNVLYGFLKSKVIGPAVKARTYLIDTIVVDAIKKGTPTDKVPFVSTNDILTSWFLHHTKCTVCAMAMNLRGRLKGHSDAHAGNYESLLFYNLADTGSPALIRESVMTYQRVITTTMPTSWETMTGSTTVVSNWSSLSKVNVIEGCTEELHMPVYDIASLLPATFAVCILFRSGQGLAVYMAGLPEKLDALPTNFMSSKKLA